MLRLLPLLAIALASLAVACTKEEEPPSTPTTNFVLQTVVARPPLPTRTPTPIPTPRSTPLPLLTEADLPVPAWTKVDHSYIEPRAQIGNQVLIDAATGELYALVPKPLSTDEGSLSVVAWLPDGRLIVRAIRQRGRDMIQRLFIGRPFARFDMLPVAYGSLPSASPSPDGKLLALQVRTDQTKVIVLETDSWTVLHEFANYQLPSRPWSHDSAFLVLASTDPRPLSSRIDIVRVSDARGETITASAAAWSNAGSGLAYAGGSATSPDLKPLTLRNIDTGDEISLGSGDGALYWSPDDRFLVVGRSAGQLSKFEVVDTTGQQRNLLVRGAWFRGWIDEDTLYLVANVCKTYDLATVNADGSGYSLLTDAGQYTYAGLSASFSPDRSRFAYQLGKLHIKSFPKGPGLELDVRPFELNRFAEVWSPDGRFLVLTVLGGRDGPCYPVPTPQVTSIEYR